MPHTVRVALVADTHGVLDHRVQRVALGCDLVVHAGDVGARAVLDALGDGDAARVLAVRGNNDTPGRWPSGEEDLPESLPPEVRLELPGGVLVAVHGDDAGRPARRHEVLRQRYPEARAVVYGHSHRHCVDRGGTPWVLNPGAAGRARTYGGPSCLVLEASAGAWRLRRHRFELLPRKRRATLSKC